MGHPAPLSAEFAVGPQDFGFVQHPDLIARLPGEVRLRGHDRCGEEEKDRTPEDEHMHRSGIGLPGDAGVPERERDDVRRPTPELVLPLLRLTLPPQSPATVEAVGDRRE
jgi:hypothetical protein